jgi:hypothetical protein
MSGVGWVPSLTAITQTVNNNGTITTTPYKPTLPDCGSSAPPCCKTPSTSFDCCRQYYYVTVDVTFQGVTTPTPRIYKTIIYDNCTATVIDVQT